MEKFKKKHNYEGLLIVIEVKDGSGKSTLVGTISGVYQPTA